MPLPGPDRYSVSQPCVVCWGPATSSMSDFCASHREWVQCAVCEAYVEESQQSRTGERLCDDCYLARSCDVCGRESDDIREGTERRMCPTCYKPIEIEEVA